jgi:hypothetical protein
MRKMKDKIIKIFRFSNLALLVIILFNASCATSMTPIEVNNMLPTLTESELITPNQASESVKLNKCKYLVKGRNYTAPMGNTVKGDLTNAAKGIDEWVKLDKGNAYVLISYKWVNVGDQGATQLHIVFDTMLCNE